jgi:hypothetical protein
VIKETVEQYLARGGKIQRIPAVEQDFSQKISLNPNSVTRIMDLDEGAHFFSEIRIKKKKKKLDTSALPESLRKLARKASR